MLGGDVHVALKALAGIAFGEVDALGERRTFVVRCGTFVHHWKLRLKPDNLVAHLVQSGLI